MIYRIAADLVVLLHFSFICFVILGGLSVLRWRWLMFVHLPVVIWGALVELMHWSCPLTSLENSLRYAAGEHGYAGGFIEYYIIPIIYPAGLTDEIQLVLGISVIVINAVIYTFVLRIYLRQKSRIN